MTRRFSFVVGSVVAASALCVVALIGLVDTAGAQGVDALDASVASGVIDQTVGNTVRNGPLEAIVSFSVPIAAQHALEVSQSAPVEGEELPTAAARALPGAFGDLKRSTFAETAGAGVTVVNDFENVNSAVVRVANERALRALVGQSNVTSVTPIRRMKAYLAESLPYIGQPQVANGNPPYRGAGTYVAVLDTGVDYTQPAFGSCTAPGTPTCKVVASIDSAPDDGVRDNPPGQNHGTNVSAIVLGVAPDTKLFVSDVERADGFIYTNDVLAAVSWVVGRKNAGFNIKALNMSFGGGNFNSNCADDSGVATLLANGIQPVASAGNEGYRSGRVTGIGGPACIAGVLSVGMTYGTTVSGFGAISWGSPEVCRDGLPVQPDKIACVSSAAPILSILGPGYEITAGGVTMSGTSMASPHVAGAVAVLAGARLTATPTEIRTALTSSGVSLFDTRIGQSFPRLYLPGAVAAIAPSGGTGGTTSSTSSTSSSSSSSSTSSSSTTRATTTSSTTTTTTRPCRFRFFCGGSDGGTTAPTTSSSSTSTTQPGNPTTQPGNPTTQPSGTTTTLPCQFSIFCGSGFGGFGGFH